MLEMRDLIRLSVLAVAMIAAASISHAQNPRSTPDATPEEIARAVDTLKGHWREILQTVNRLDGQFGFDGAPETLRQAFVRNGVDWAQRYVRSWGENGLFLVWAQTDARGPRNFLSDHAASIEQSITVIERSAVLEQGDLDHFRRGMGQWRIKVKDIRQVLLGCYVPAQARRAKSLDRVNEIRSRIYRVPESQRQGLRDEAQRREGEANGHYDAAKKCLDRLKPIMASPAFVALQARPRKERVYFTLSTPELVGLNVEVRRRSMANDIEDLEGQIDDLRRGVDNRLRRMRELTRDRINKFADREDLRRRAASLDRQLNQRQLYSRGRPTTTLHTRLAGLQTYRDELIRLKINAEDQLIANSQANRRDALQVSRRALDRIEAELQRLPARISRLQAEIEAGGGTPLPDRAVQQIRRNLTDAIRGIENQVVAIQTRVELQTREINGLRRSYNEDQERIHQLEERVLILRTEKRRLDRSIGKIQSMEAQAGGKAIFEAHGEDLSRLSAVMDEVRQRLRDTTKEYRDITLLRQFLRSEYLYKAQVVAEANTALFWNELENLLYRTGLELGTRAANIALAAPNPFSVLVEVLAQLGEIVYGNFLGGEPIIDFSDTSVIQEAVMRARRKLDGELRNSEPRGVCRYWDSENNRPVILSAAQVEPNAPSPGKRWVETASKTSLVDSGKATISEIELISDGRRLRRDLERQLRKVDSWQRWPREPERLLDEVWPGWRQDPRIPEILAEEKEKLAQIRNRIRNWDEELGKSMRDALKGVIFSILIDIAKDEAMAYLEKQDLQLYANFFQVEFQMTYRWYAFMAASCHYWKIHDRLKSLQIIYQQMQRRFDLSRGYVVSTNERFSNDEPLQVYLGLTGTTLSFGSYELEIAGVRGVRLNRGTAYKFPAHAFDRAQRGGTLPVRVIVSPQ